MRPLTARERRLVALGLLLALTAILWLAVLGPLIGGFFDRAQARRDLIAAYERNERVLRSLPRWRAVAEAQRRQSDRFAIAAPNEQQAVEALKERVLRQAAQDGYTVTAVQDLQASAAEGQVKVRADLLLSLGQLYATLRRLSTEGTYVIVEYISISADRAFATGHAAPLAVRLELSGDWHPSRVVAS